MLKITTSLAAVSNQLACACVYILIQTDCADKRAARAEFIIIAILCKQRDACARARKVPRLTCQPVGFVAAALQVCLAHLRAHCSAG